MSPRLHGVRARHNQDWRALSPHRRPALALWIVCVVGFLALLAHVLATEARLHLLEERLEQTEAGARDAGDPNSGAGVPDHHQHEEK
ncbi:MAG: carbohydrate porin [Deltaproteobacteria bacterium]|nr:carbohydrate porin [Deltaproteobacteria bacterium]